MKNYPRNSPQNQDSINFHLGLKLFLVNLGRAFSSPDHRRDMNFIRIFKIFHFLREFFHFFKFRQRPWDGCLPLIPAGSASEPSPLDSPEKILWIRHWLMLKLSTRYSRFSAIFAWNFIPIPGPSGSKIVYRCLW